MKILIINAGSSSLKYQLIQMEAHQNQSPLGDNPRHSHRVMAAGVLERIGESEGTITHKKYSMAIRKAIDNATCDPTQAGIDTHRNAGDTAPSEPIPEKFVKKQRMKDHRDAMHLAARMISAPDSGVIDSMDDIDAIGHRVVQGGEKFNASIRIDADVKKAIKENNPLAPLHNPPNLIGIEVAEELFPGIPNVAVFDTEFHQTIPPKAYMYALPYDFYQKYRVRRYGFHGTSHKYVAATATELMKQAGTITGTETGSIRKREEKRDAFNLITVHLGNGCSICAIDQGKCVDTSMGMTPLAGVMMGTRTGDMDPAIQKYLLESTDLTPEALDTIFNKESGLKGICGMNDMRDIHAEVEKGNALAKLALEMFSYQVRKYIGSYMAVLGHVDGIIFTAGIGENDSVVREKICSNLSGLGIELNPEKNNGPVSEPKAIHSQNSSVALWVIPTNEELQIAREVVEVLT